MSDLDLAVTPDERAALRAEIAGWETDLGLAETITRRAACERVAPDGSIRATEILAVLDSRRWS